MKLDRVALHGFLSHTDTDWSPNGAKLVTLIGPNGAGKSSLAVDGLLYTLFDDARGKTDDLVQLGANDMSALVEFVHAGGRYRVTRGRTTRAGGKSFLELAVAGADGAWQPLTADSIRETQARIEELLHVDAATFETAVVLVQGDAMRFAQATGTERKRILSTVLDLGIYPKAEALARDEARSLEATSLERTGHLHRLEQLLEARPAVEAGMATAGATVAALEAQMTTVNAEREAAEARLVELAGQIAAGEAAAADVKRLDAELLAIRTRWIAARDRRDYAARAIAGADATLAGADAIAAAAAWVPDLAAEVDRLEASERRAGELDAQVAAQLARAGHDQAAAAHRARYEAARATVDRLAAAVTKLQPVDCPKCGTRIVVDQADMQGQLTTARREFLALEASAPKEPLGFALEAAAILRLEIKRREIVVDRAALADARANLAIAERQAARAEVMEQATQAKVRAQEESARTFAELEVLDADGRRGAAALSEAKAKAAGQDAFLAERDRVTATVTRIRAELPQLAREHAGAVADVAQGRTRLDELDAREAERDALAAVQEARTVDVGRRLVAAFGVTGIPARIIESVLPELTEYARQLLAELRPGMELSIRAQRAKKDGKGIVEALDLIVQDAAGERPLAMFSGGERMSVALAVAVGLSRLVARRAGTALRTLVVDEPDGLDAEARRAFGQALRVLAHGGELSRVVLVSHHEDLAEFGDETYRVSKGPQGSVVELVA